MQLSFLCAMVTCGIQSRYHHQTMNVRVDNIAFYRLPMRTRFPFRYGIASMTELPHLFVVATVHVAGKICRGVAADGLPPKWFTKNPDTKFEQDDLPEMLRVIRHAADIAIEIQEHPSPFLWWWHLYHNQQHWARQSNTAPLLAGFGASLIERAVIDAVCRASGLTFFQSLQANALGIDFGLANPSLSGWSPADVLPDLPRRQVQLRHTVGLGDPLADDDIDPTERLDDGLPYSLVDNIRAYGLRFFKIKLQGDIAKDRERLIRLAAIFDQHVGPEVRFTLDGNEQYDNIGDFAQAWNALREPAAVRNLFDQSLLFVEQPLHRDHALDESVAAGLSDWGDAPPIIIDESDADLDSLPTALRLGYSGTSHKNCKGVFKSILSAVTIRLQHQANPRLAMSGEDLANVGPVALLQDLAVVAALGIEHVERNGHHYFAGLSMYPSQTQQQVLARHGDLYRMHDRGFVTLAPQDGQLELDSVNQSPFGVAEIPDLTALQAWEF